MPRIERTSLIRLFFIIVEITKFVIVGRVVSLVDGVVFCLFIIIIRHQGDFIFDWCSVILVFFHFSDYIKI